MMAAPDIDRAEVGGLSLRPAGEEDMRRVFDWRNLPEIIAVATVKRPMIWADHQRWFAESLRGERRRLYIITEHGEPIGQLRFDFAGDEECEVSVYLIPGFTGRGLGAAAIRLGCEDLEAANPARRFTAWVRVENERSVRAFGRAGFMVDPFGLQKPGHFRLTRLPLRRVPHVRLTHGPEEENAVTSVVRSGQWAGGALATEVEGEFARMAGVSHAVLTGSGLGALRLALLALGVGPGARVAVPAYACVALANAVLNCGAEPVPVEVEEGSWNLCPRALRRAKAASPALNTAIVVHTFGQPAAVAELRACGVRVIEDCSHAFGRGALGSLGDVAVLSLYATKLIGAGEGGVILTSDPAIAGRLRDVRNYTDRPALAGRLNDKIHGCAAALARCQLRRLPELLARRDEVAGNYEAGLRSWASSAGVGMPAPSAGRVWYRYALRVPDAARVIERLQALGIEAARPNEPWCDNGSFPVAAAGYRELVSLPIYPTLTPAEQHQVLLGVWSAAANTSLRS